MRFASPNPVPVSQSTWVRLYGSCLVCLAPRSTTSTTSNDFLTCFFFFLPVNPTMAAVARPKLLNTGRRPSSAIFLGGHGNTPPALPEPPRTPSPEEDHPDHSGLPSPPATVSAGSNEGNTNEGSLRLRSQSPFISDEQHNSPADMATQRGSRAYRPRSRSRSRSRASVHESSYRVEDEDEDDEIVNDEDYTAKFNLDRRKSMPADTTLQRIRDLNERSRMVSIILFSQYELSSQASVAVHR